jgi:hypothetical protein
MRGRPAGPTPPPGPAAGDGTPAARRAWASRWHQAFGAWKTAVFLQQLYDRYQRGETSDQRMAHHREQVTELALQARHLLLTTAR